MLKSLSFVDGYGDGDTITRVDDDTGGFSCGIKGKDRRDANLEAWDIEGFEEDLGHLLSVGLWVLGGFS
jgi:hypothetical protein